MSGWERKKVVCRGASCTSKEGREEQGSAGGEARSQRPGGLGGRQGAGEVSLRSLVGGRGEDNKGAAG